MKTIDLKDPRAIWSLYSQGQSYNESIGLYDTVDECERFYAGDQWHGVNAPDLDKPVLNIITRPINIAVSNIVSDDVAISLSPSMPSVDDEQYLAGVLDEIERIREQCNMQTVGRELVRNAAVDGDALLYLYWNEEIKNGQDKDGDIAVELLENTHCIFGNSNDANPQKQPYIILVTRRYIDDIITEAREYGMSEDDIDTLIKPDDGDGFGETDTDRKLVTRLAYYYKASSKDGKKKSVHCVISTARAIIREDFDTELTLYPIAWMNWQRTRQSYHGTSVAQSIIPNQIMVNKLIAEKNRCVQLYAWPKIVYDETVLPDGWDNRIGKNIKVNRPVDRVFQTVVPGADASSQVTELIEMLISHSMESIGANDAATGNMSSENTSAIIALQEASTVPLTLQRQGYYDMQEQITRIMLDMLRANAGTRNIPYTEQELAEMANVTQPTDGTLPQKLYDPTVANPELIGTEDDPAKAPAGTRKIDFGKLGDMAYQIQVDVGAGSMWSEITTERMMENLFQRGIIDGRALLENIPKRFMGGKRDSLIDAYDKRMQQMRTAPVMGGAPNMMDVSGARGISPRVDNAKAYIDGLKPRL